MVAAICVLRFFDYMDINHKLLQEQGSLSNAVVDSSGKHTPQTNWGGGARGTPTKINWGQSLAYSSSL